MKICLGIQRHFIILNERIFMITFHKSATYKNRKQVNETYNVPENERNFYQFYTNTIDQTVTSSALAVDHECFEQHRSGMKRIYTPIRKRKC